ncbi:MAG TPA: calcium-translocating P-type ATPase, PMCA-type [Gemmataceae bacterium]|nr:calcium-translocating P-type ATPase, PMCA-type [Gemmataceae bacterium]
MRTLREIYGLFPAARERGLGDEAVAQSLSRFGANQLTPLPREPLWQKFLEKFDEPIIKILLAATLLKTVVDLFASPGPWGLIGLALVVAAFVVARVFRLREWLPSLLFGVAVLLVGLSAVTPHPSFEGLAVMVAVILATGVAFLSEYKSDREFEVLNAQKESLRAKVLRAGEVRTVPLEGVVVGDLVVLEMGDELPADGRIVKATELQIDQSLLTGESEPVRKVPRPEEDPADGPDEPGCVYRGAQVVDGAGEMVVTEVGDLTMIGQIARRLSADTPDEDEPTPAAGDERARVKQKLTISKEQTPLQQKLTVLAGMISRVGYAAAVAIFAALLIRGVALTHEVRLAPRFAVDPATGDYVTDDAGRRTTDPAAGQLETTGQALRDSVSALLGYFVYLVIIIVVAVPEGLPMSVTVSLALAMRKMTRANSLVRQLVACETIGSATVICSDKTGTLTQNRMRVDQVGLGGELYDRTGEWPKPAVDLHSAADWLALNATVNSTANLEEKEGKTVVVGNSTEGALLRWARDAGVEYGERRARAPVLYQMHFSSDRKRMTSVVEADNRLLVLVKGAPEIVLDHCTHRLDRGGQVVPLTWPDRELIADQLRAASARAMRTLAFAHRDLPPGLPRDEAGLHDRRDEVERELVFTGFVGIRDPIRPEVPEALTRCREGGIDVKMITGDNVETARAIGREVGLLDTSDALTLSSDEFNKLSDDDLKQRLPRLRILARARPLDKLRMVRLLQDQGHVVAVTGDGTNDAPALKRADVGLAMGVAGTEVAKEASKIVLLDDSFATIVKAVHWGRALYENIQRFIQFQLTINVSALAIAFLGPFLGVKPPFTVLQLLWINVIMDTFAAIALCSEPPRPGLMRLPPKRRDESILTPAMRRTILTTAGFFVAAMLGLLLAMKAGGFAEGSGPNPDGWDFAPLNVRQVSFFFTAYVLFQVWNMINCRSLSPDASGLRRVWRNRSFLGIMAAILIGQFLIVSVGGAVFAVEPLGLLDWLVIVVATSSVLVFAEIVRRARRARGKQRPA